MFDVWYWAVLERNKDGRYFAFVPDLPGATASGATEKDVLITIAEIAADYVRDLVEDGHPVPKARNSNEIERDPESNEYGRAAIPVDVPGRSVKISISIDEALLKRIDRAANGMGMTRSGFLADSAQLRLEGQRERTKGSSVETAAVGGLSYGDDVMVLSGAKGVLAKAVASEIVRQGGQWVQTQGPTVVERRPHTGSVRSLAASALTQKGKRGADKRK